MPCVACGEVPTEPISPQRLEYQIATWLCERDEEHLLPMLHLITEESEGEGLDRCIFTGYPVTICGRCYVRSVHAMLLAVAPTLTEEFVRFFTFADERSEFPIEREANSLNSSSSGSEGGKFEYESSLLNILGVYRAKN